MENIIEKHLETNGFYEPNWFHMYISNFHDSELNFDNCKEEQLGLYMHEYAHYLQNITSIGGVRNAIEYYKFVNNLRFKIAHSQELSIPLTDKLLIDGTIYFNNINQFKGGCSIEKGIHFERFDISICTREFNDKRTDEFVRLDFFGKETSDVIGYVEFGSECVREGMARSLQRIYHDSPEQPVYPYHITELIVDQYCPEISNSPLKIATISQLALNYENPGKHFHRLIKEYNELHSFQSFQQFVLNELNEKKIVLNGESGYSLKEIFYMSINELRGVLKTFLNSNHDYLKDLLDNIIQTEQTHPVLFYEILGDKNLNPREKLDELKAIYGVPVIQIDSGALIFPYPNDRIPQELIELLSVKSILDRITESKGRKLCRFYLFCQNSEDDNTDEWCFDKQWLREIECPMKQVMDHWKIADKLPR